MLNHMVGFGDLAESLAVVTGLSARRLARTLAQAADPRRLRLELFELFNPSRRSNSAIRAFKAAFSTESV
jgi:hypothetical protein